MEDSPGRSNRASGRSSPRSNGRKGSVNGGMVPRSPNSTNRKYYSYDNTSGMMEATGNPHMGMKAGRLKSLAYSNMLHEDRV